MNLELHFEFCLAFSPHSIRALHIQMYIKNVHTAQRYDQFTSADPNLLKITGISKFSS